MSSCDQPAPRCYGGERIPTLAASTRERWLVAWGAMLFGYALCGKGFAYAGYPPIFVGEIVLTLGVFTAILFGRGRELFDSPLAWLVLCFAAWGLCRTLPYLSEYRADALRDAVLWGYGAFALLVPAIVMADPRSLVRLIAGYERLTRPLLLGVPIVTVLFRLFFYDHPVWPGSGVPVLQQKEGDVLVHMAGIAAFWMSGLARPAVRWPWVILLACNVAVMGAVDRAGFLSFAVVVALCAFCRPRHTLPLKLFALAATFILALWITNVRIEVPGGKGREISFDQFATNVASVAGDTGEHGMDSTKEWRLDWWQEILSYTLNGPYFWSGKGFGVNLADDDGFQVLSTGALRSPHNVHMTVLARMGVPGLVFWAMFLTGTAATTARSYRIAQRAGHDRWASVFLFLGAFTLACTVNASFDVFIEGPMGGIWFWSLLGLCLCSTWIYRTHPEVLE
jgi:hypothetical protein